MATLRPILKSPTSNDVFKAHQITLADASNAISATAEILVGGDAHRQSVPSNIVAETFDTFDRATNTTAISYRVGQVYSVPVNQITSNPFNPRYLYPRAVVDEMGMALAAKGQLVAATGFVGDDGNIVLIEGETRLRGARSANLPTLRVEIRQRPNTDLALYEEARDANVKRKDQSPLDDAMRWRDLLARKIYKDQKSIANALGLKDDVVSRTLSLAAMSQGVIDSVAEYPELLNLKMLVAIREFAELKGDDPTRELILEVARNGLGAREVTARRIAAEKPDIKRPRSNKEKVFYMGGIGELKTFEGRVELSLDNLTPEAVAAVTEALRHLLTAVET